MKLMHALPLLIYISFPKCPPFIFRFSTFYGPQVCKSKNVHSTIFLCCTLWTFIEYLISLYKLFAHCYFFEIMNHLTLCSSSNHLLYPCFLLYCKVHVSFITFILEDEHELSLGMLMHLKCIHELCTIIVIFQSYLHHIRGILLLFNDFW